MYSAAWVNQFEIKDRCIESVINNLHGKVKMWSKIEFKNKFAEILQGICRNIYDLINIL